VGTESAIAQVERRTDIAHWRRWRGDSEVAVFHYYLDLEMVEIASLMRIPEGTVKSTLHRARRSLAEALGEDEETLEVGDVAS
jgi:hypothetical protein